MSRAEMGSTLAVSNLYYFAPLFSAGSQTGNIRLSFAHVLHTSLSSGTPEYEQDSVVLQTAE